MNYQPPMPSGPVGGQLPPGSPPADPYSPVFGPHTAYPGLPGPPPAIPPPYGADQVRYGTGTSDALGSPFGSSFNSSYGQPFDSPFSSSLSGSFGASTPVVWGAPAPKPKRTSTAVKLAIIVVGFAVAVGLVNIVWNALTPERTAVPTAEHVTLGTNGLPAGYEWAGDLQAGGDKLICGPVTWELLGDVPGGGRKAVQEAVDLAAEMTGVSIEPVRQVDIPAVEITFEYVPSRELQGSSTKAGGDTIGLALTQHTSFGITESQILLDEPFFDTALRSNHDEAVLTILHEIGHAFGLGHSNVPDSLMYPSTSGRSRITAEDVAAFATVAPSCTDSS
jgi:hypothetical protein